jgi:hypothetical protein
MAAIISYRYCPALDEAVRAPIRSAQALLWASGWATPIGIAPFLDRQPLDLTDVPEGRYRLVHRVEAELLESDYENNAASMLLELRWPGSPEEPPTVEVPESCPDAARCLCGQWASVIKFLPNADSQSLYRGRATSSPGDPSPLTPCSSWAPSASARSSKRARRGTLTSWYDVDASGSCTPLPFWPIRAPRARQRFKKPGSAPGFRIGIHHLGPETRKRPERTLWARPQGLGRSLGLW